MSTKIRISTGCALLMGLLLLSAGSVPAQTAEKKKKNQAVRAKIAEGINPSLPNTTKRSEAAREADGKEDAYRKADDAFNKPTNLRPLPKTAGQARGKTPSHGNAPDLGTDNTDAMNLTRPTGDPLGEYVEQKPEAKTKTPKDKLKDIEEDVVCDAKNMLAQQAAYKGFENSQLKTMIENEEGVINSCGNGEPGCSPKLTSYGMEQCRADQKKWHELCDGKNISFSRSQITRMRREINRRAKCGR